MPTITFSFSIYSEMGVTLHIMAVNVNFNVNNFKKSKILTIQFKIFEYYTLKNIKNV